jgi:benzoylformate decarboxylase
MDIVNPAIDFLSLATSMSLSARRVDRAADVAPALEAAISSGIPNLIEIPNSSE